MPDSTARLTMYFSMKSLSALKGTAHFLLPPAAPACEVDTYACNLADVGNQVWQSKRVDADLNARIHRAHP